MLKPAQDNDEIITRVAALDIGKAEVMCCVRVPDPDCPGRRVPEVRPCSTMTRSILLLAARLTKLAATRVAMASTADCWNPVRYLLEAAGPGTWPATATGARPLPGPPT